MRLSFKIFVGIGVAAALLFLGVETRRWRQKKLPEDGKQTTSEPAAREPVPLTRPEDLPAQTVSRRPNALSVDKPSPEELTNGGQRIREILDSDLEAPQKGRKLLELFPQLPAALQEEAAEHMANLLTDEAFAGVKPILTNAQTPEAVIDVLMGDLLNRSNALKLPLLLEILRTTEHPKSREAREILEVYVEKDFGTDWAAWEQAITAWLKDNPDA